MANPLPNRTENLPDRKYYDPDSEENWADPLEAVIEEVSANAIVSGPNRSDFDPIDGQLYIPSDGGDWFLGTGTAWENLGPIGDITGHTNDTTNPHSVTATQADALPTSGGTVTGNVTFGNTTHDTITTAQLNNGGPISDGDGVERRIWVIAAGASDPADATADDIIFEEEP